MSTEGSVTHWFHEMQAGNQEAARQLWERFFAKLVELSRRRLTGAPKHVADEEDVALSALDSFYRGAQRGRFPSINDRESLWRLLVVIANRKAVDQILHHNRKRRDESRRIKDDEHVDAIVADVMCREPTPEFASQMKDELQRLLDLLEHEDLRKIAVWKMEGYANHEIAAKLSRGLTTIERKLRTIRAIWKSDDA